MRRILHSALDIINIYLVLHGRSHCHLARAGRFAPAADDDWTVTSVKVGEPSEDYERFAVSPDGRELWTASPRGRIAIVDVPGKKLLQTVEAGVTGANRVAFTPDGKRVLISRLSAPAGSPGHIVVFDAASRREIGRINAGPNPDGIAWTVAP
jgi:DNA-binding beta-propeller fold protein YncE